MTAPCKMGLIVLSCVAVGALGSEALHSQPRPPAYLIGQIDVSDPEGYAKEYLPKAKEIIKSHGGQLVAAAGAAGGSQVVAIDGAAPKRVVIYEYPEHGSASGLAKRSGVRASSARWREVRKVQHLRRRGRPILMHTRRERPTGPVCPLGSLVARIWPAALTQSPVCEVGLTMIPWDASGEDHDYFR